MARFLYNGGTSGHVWGASEFPFTTTEGPVFLWPMSENEKNNIALPSDGTHHALLFWYASC